MQSRRILAAAGGPGTQDRDRKSTRLNSSHTVIYTLSLHDALPISEAVARYRVEPFVIAADVYAVPPHTGRGGWTWYTGSAGWMYRLITESLLGVRLDVDKLRFAPCLPPG